MKKILITLVLLSSIISNTDIIRNKSENSAFLKGAKLVLKTDLTLIRGDERYKIGKHCYLNFKQKFTEDVIIKEGAEIEIETVTENGSYWINKYDEVKFYTLKDSENIEKMSCYRSRHKNSKLLTVEEVVVDINKYLDVISMPQAIEINP